MRVEGWWLSGLRSADIQESAGSRQMSTPLRMASRSWRLDSMDGPPSCLWLFARFVLFYHWERSLTGVPGRFRAVVLLWGVGAVAPVGGRLGGLAAGLRRGVFGGFRLLAVSFGGCDCIRGGCELAGAVVFRRRRPVAATVAVVSSSHRSVAAPPGSSCRSGLFFRHVGAAAP